MFSAHPALQFLAGSKQFHQNKNDNMCVLRYLPYKPQLPVYFPLKSYQISLCGAPAVIFIRGFLATGHVNVIQKISIKRPVSGFLEDGCCDFTGVCSVNMLSV